MITYSSKLVEQKWRKRWTDSGLYGVNLNDAKKKYYSLVMFPYPSSDKLHIGHWYNFAPADTYARFMRMRGYRVFEPMGFDAFGLPAENYAVKTGIHPAKTTADNIATMTEQLSQIGAMYDWSKKVNTSDPSYYLWTQWLFLQMYKHGLAYRKQAPVNWCPDCKTVLANEQVWEGACERCDSQVVQKNMTQWFWKMSAYAQRLLDGHETLKDKWPGKTIIMQKNWIGRREGINIDYEVVGLEESITVFTTRPDTNFGATFLVVAPDSDFVRRHIADFPNRKETEAYIAETAKKTERERISEGRKKTGVFTGLFAINNLNKRKMPIYVGDFVLATVGTGNVVAVPGHDLRDFEFAQTMGLEIIRVVVGPDGDTSPITQQEQVQEETGIMTNSDFLNGMDIHKATEVIMDYIEKQGWGKRVINYRLRDWLISRQRLWGAPIPIIYCKKCGEIPVPEKALPVLLPTDIDFKPRGDGKSPLATSSSFVKTTCPKCNGQAERETDTMDTFVCSSFYYLRYLDPKNDKEFCGKKLAKSWMPVDMYIGGPEHACMHLIYARFVNMCLHDWGYSPCDEPFARLVHQGLITYKGAKMSKSKGNVVSPDPFIEKYGSDVFRMYLMFMGPFEEGGDWSDRGITGIARFVERLWRLLTTKTAVHDAPEIQGGGTLRTRPSTVSPSTVSSGQSNCSGHALVPLLNKTIKKVTEDIEKLHFNTALAALMEFLNAAAPRNAGPISFESKKILTELIAPLAPHFAEEAWEALGQPFSIFNTAWPEINQQLLQEETVTIVVQINGKVRGRLPMPKNTTQEEAFRRAKAEKNVKQHIAGKKIEKVIFVPGKLLSFVIDTKELEAALKCRLQRNK